MSCGCITESIGNQTACECKAAGYCQRHKCQKTEHFYNLCKGDVRYFALWEDGRGPCIAGPNGMPAAVAEKPTDVWFGVGDLAELLIRLVTFGRLKPWPGCGCDKRKAWLNQWKIWRRNAT